MSSRIMCLFCSDSVASPSQWLLNPDCSIRAPKASGPHPGMRCQNSGENPGENCGEHLDVLVALFLSGKHLGDRSKPTPTENHWTQLFEGVRADINFTLFDCHTSRLNRLLRVQLSLNRGSNVGWTGGRSKCLICWSSLTSSGNHVETQTANGKQTEWVKHRTGITSLWYWGSYQAGLMSFPHGFTKRVHERKMAEDFHHQLANLKLKS